MGGGKSSSSNTQTQENIVLSSDGVVTGDLFQGKEVTVNQQLPDAAVDVFKQLVSLTGQSLDLVGKAGDRALGLSESSIAAVSDRTSFSEQPELQTVTRFIPVFMVAAVALVAWQVFKK